MLLFELKIPNFQRQIKLNSRRRKSWLKYLPTIFNIRNPKVNLFVTLFRLNCSTDHQEKDIEYHSSRKNVGKKKRLLPKKKLTNKIYINENKLHANCNKREGAQRPIRTHNSCPGSTHRQFSTCKVEKSNFFIGWDQGECSELYFEEELDKNCFGKLAWLELAWETLTKTFEKGVVKINQV